MRTGRPRLEVCKRGHSLAETRIVTPGRTQCRLCMREAVKKYQRSHPVTSEQNRARYEKKLGRQVRTVWGHYSADPKTYMFRRKLEKFYGITLEQYNEMVEAQGGRCAICNKKPAGTSHVSRRLCVDHDHDTGFVRGLLCHQCNVTIGMIEDSPELLDRMRRYLGKHAQLRLVEKN